MPPDATQDQPSALPASACAASRGVPDGYAIIPLNIAQVRVPLRLCVVVGLEPDPVAGHLVVLRDTAEARVVLGCVADAGGCVHQWTEVWLQNLAGFESFAAGPREALSNAILDERWRRHFQTFESLDPAVLIRTGWETEPPLPVWLDLAQKQPVHPVVSSSNEAWRLCRDEAILSGAGLPGYGASLHRYLYLPKLGSKSPLVPVTAHAPTSAQTRPLSDVLGGRADLIPLNLGGLMLVRAHSPLGLEAFIDVLGGGPSNTSLHGRSPLDLGDALPTTGQGTDDGWLFIGQHGKWGQLLEGLHLKLRLLAGIVDEVRASVAHVQRPLLNLDAGCFQVRLGERGAGLPSFWTARPLLVDPGDAVELPVRTSDAAYYLPARAPAGSIYRPAEVGHSAQGRCAVRIRQVLPDTGGATIIEGTFATQERVVTAKNDLVRLRVVLGSGGVDLYARLEEQAALTAGEWRFRTIGQRLPADADRQLRAAEGVPLANSTFELLPLLSTPCDLYALGVLAVRTLLVNPAVTLPVALDAVLSLARQVGQAHDGQSSLRSRVRAAFDADPRWLEALGPHRLAWEGAKPREAFDLIPPQIWWDALAMIVRCFPGVGPDSVCADYGDARPGGLHKVFDPLRDDLQSLLIRSRSLIVIDWRYNREISAVIRAHAAGPAGAGQPASGAGQPASGAVGKSHPPAAWHDPRPKSAAPPPPRPAPVRPAAAVDRDRASDPWEM